MSRKEKMKIYHGIPTPSYVNKGESVHIDFSNEFYGKGVRTVVDRKASTGGNKTSLTITDGISGMSAKFTKAIESVYDHCVILNEEFDFKDEVSISAIIKTKDIQAYFSGLYLMRVVDPAQNLVTPNADTVYRFLGLDKVANSPKDKLSLSAYDNNVTVPGKVIVVDVPTDTYMHYQFVCKNMITYIYINGELISTQDMSDFGMTLTKFNCIRFLFPVDIGGELCVENLVVSRNTNIYPNRIPEDYLQGKALIKPRLNQQQIKGDPLISQVTELIVPNNTEDLGNYSKVANADGTFTHNEKPELACNGASLWHNGSKIRISALNNEIISGVIDSDTALSQIYPTNSGTCNVFKALDVSKLSVGDTFKIFNYNTNANGTSDITITNIEGNLITISPSQNVATDSLNHIRYLFETTVNSSSPIVKTTDGTTVNGTWTGLGTSQALFTTSNNSPLPTGKDLVVTYSLNMPQGNSHFPELPSDIGGAYTETGIEMKPVSEIVIEDDFVGKTKDDSVNCPHYMKLTVGGGVSTSLETPSSSYLASPASSERYVSISKLDGKEYGTYTQTLNSIPQMFFAFNLIRIIEDKIGTIPSTDKIRWIKDNIQSAKINVYGKGENPTSNKVIISGWCYSDKRWYADPKSTTGATGNLLSVSYLFSNNSNPATDWLNKAIDSNGFIYSTVYTNACDGVTQSSIYLDYINIEVRMKVDSTFTTLYCDNKRAREDKCNPVLIQKETKTVKRYIPSKECFVTESKYFNPISSKGDTTLINNNPQILTSQQGNSLLTYGTGSSYEGNYQLKGSIARLKPEKPSYSYSGEILKVNNTFLDGAIPMRYLSRQGEGMSYFDNFGEVLVDTSKYLANNMLLTRCKLSNMNGEVKMLVYMADILNKKFVGESLKIFTLPNRPLIK